MWKRLSPRPKISFRRPDVIGVLLLAGQIFEKRASKYFVIFSDMRNITIELGLESLVIVPSYSVFQHDSLLPKLNLGGVQVFALGVGDYGKRTPYYESLRQFWFDCINGTGGDLRVYSILRDLQRCFSSY